MSIAGNPQPGGPAVLFVESYPHVMYGQQRTLLALLEQWGRGRGTPLVGVTADGPFADAVRRLGVEVVRFDYPPLLARYGGAVYRDRGAQRLKLGWQAARYVLRARKTLRERKIAGVYSNDMRGILTIGLAARSLGIPVMIWDKLDRPHGWLDLLELPLATVTVFIAEAVKAKFPAWQLRAFRRRIHTVPDGVDLERFDAARENRRRLGIRNGDVVIAQVGLITQRKGQDRLLAVVPRLVAAVPEATILIVGSVSGSEEDRKYEQSLPNRDHPRVQFLGAREDIPRIMHSIDLLVMPSRSEGLGLVLQEAMACGKPVVAARAGGIPEVVVDGRTGLLFEGDDPGQLVDSLVRLCRCAELRESLGRAGRRRVEEHYDRRVQIARVADLLSRMVESKGKRWRRGLRDVAWEKGD